MSITLEQLMDPEDMQKLGVSSMTSEQQKVLIDWGMKMHSLGQHVVEDIEKVKYDGRLIILEDGSRWEVDSGDSYTSDSWSSSCKVLVLDGTMYNLDEMEKVEVQPEE